MRRENYAIVVAVIILLIFIYFVYIKRTNTNGNTNGNTKISQNENNSKNEIIRTLVRQAARWSTAAEQDENALVALLHANYGSGYLWALLDIARHDEIEKATGIDTMAFRDAIIAVQDKATRKVSAMCPGFAPQGTYLAKIAGDI